MKINNITNNNISHFHDANKKKQGIQKGNGVQSSDRIEISDKARILQTNKVSSKKFSEIKEKINSGFYNSQGVIDKVAESILKELS